MKIIVTSLDAFQPLSHDSLLSWLAAMYTLHNNLRAIMKYQQAKAIRTDINQTLMNIDQQR